MRKKENWANSKWILIACVASVSVWFRSKERPRSGIFGFGRERNEIRAKKGKRGGGGGGEGRKPPFLPHPFPALLLTPFFARSSFLVLRVLRNIFVALLI